MPITKKVQFIYKKNFAKIEFDKKSKTFILLIVTLKVLLLRITIEFLKKVHNAALKQNMALIQVMTKYLLFLNIFLKKNNLVLLE